MPNLLTSIPRLPTDQVGAKIEARSTGLGHQLTLPRYLGRFVPKVSGLILHITLESLGTCTYVLHTYSPR